MTDRLKPTPTRLRYLADAEAGLLPEFLSVSMGELLDAGWIEPDGVLGRWRITALGRAIRAVRILDSGFHHIVAECGDDDEPRHLGDAIKQTQGWLVQAGSLSAATKTVHQAREELRHMAATALAADPAFTVQEGQDQ